MKQNIFELSAKTNKGSEVPLAHYRGKTLLIVNTASKCGFTPQYKGLEELYKKYANSGLVVLGFPCDQFAHQEPGSDAEIAEFCSLNFGVTFPLMGKVDVNGPNANPVFRLLKKKAHGLFGSAVKWNFTKFLVSPDGERVRRFAPTVEPAAMEGAIRKELGL
jgi:glutathione peroxidase